MLSHVAVPRDRTSDDTGLYWSTLRGRFIETWPAAKVKAVCLQEMEEDKGQKNDTYPLVMST